VIGCSALEGVGDCKRQLARTDITNKIGGEILIVMTFTKGILEEFPSSNMEIHGEHRVPTFVVGFCCGKKMP